MKDESVYLPDLKLINNVRSSSKYPKNYFYNFYNTTFKGAYTESTLLLSNPKTFKHFSFNSSIKIYALNTLIDYMLSSYLLNKQNIHSKKASIIVAQIIDAGHFSKRTVYLSTTQSLFLKHKLKLTNYINHYTYSPSLINLKTSVNINKFPSE
jgi:hypothetical protein